ncbi:polyprenyl diphosphate synthase [Oceanirhabdus sp. W0125-5]|uniref:polyprenyl diphosphate synthase n=1 Tax=Oceanirhabdus sp. W0125-5 TaxID=2999116 RepID=UPI0022F2C45B|nr:polyprenyl diphosphate synthase [Oceanirhabdus sp. W0125-5]WBW96031.1 polyprenyl diphosphate synthase [Oceanirhabdus sp. W0125-5]
MTNVIEDILETEGIRIPKHIGIICDGNGRWAQNRGLPRSLGHKAGTKPIETITNLCFKLGVETLTFYVFSSENWKRSGDEVIFLMKLFSDFFIKLRNEAGNNIKVKHIGVFNNLPNTLITEIKETEISTKNNSGMVLNIALNYGGRLEITNSLKKIVNDINAGNITIDKINEDLISDYLFTSGLQDVDLIIRTSGEMRTSNFMIWQSTNAQLWFTKDHWPDFKPHHLKESIKHYNRKNI